MWTIDPYTRTRFYERPSDSQFGGCRICHNSPISRHNFGALACMGCAAFFRRVVRLDKIPECVRRESACKATAVADVTANHACKRCRYERCLKEGMNREFVRLPHTPKKKRCRKATTKATDYFISYESISQTPTTLASRNNMSLDSAPYKPRAPQSLRSLLFGPDEGEDNETRGRKTVRHHTDGLVLLPKPVPVVPKQDAQDLQIVIAGMYNLLEAKFNHLQTSYSRRHISHTIPEQRKLFCFETYKACFFTESTLLYELYGHLPIVESAYMDIKNKMYFNTLNHFTTFMHIIAYSNHVFDESLDFNLHDLHNYNSNHPQYEKIETAYRDFLRTARGILVYAAQDLFKTNEDFVVFIIILIIHRNDNHIDCAEWEETLKQMKRTWVSMDRFYRNSDRDPSLWGNMIFFLSSMQVLVEDYLKIMRLISENFLADSSLKIDDILNYYPLLWSGNLA
ncbi:hypothetical protein QR680_000165 [Steinernema hermaphroditum]|uniref:Nuclear receptor domain-containing protein n=1 Tax=Steinernema hermaphroditum TaxID=289476 RepID=A0AA39GTN9_9BILA|nr:hypothetical protein QR680_000165 [Steinernema hermaphroditum]